jgi:hypothetical protein
MRQSILDTRDDRDITLVTHIDTERLDALNAESRRANPSGFTRRRSMRLVARIDAAFLNGLIAVGDKDACDWEFSNGQDRAALRRLLAKWPEMRVSEGGV